jgi:undecaprenyl-diphosphatase
VAIAWFVGGIAILAISRWREEHKDLPGEEMMDMQWYSALLIGLIQCAAVWPGTSRSLVTIVGGVLIGLNLRSAVIFSFLLGAVTLSASTAYDALTHGQLMVDSYGMPAILTGFLTAFLSAMVAVKWMVNYLKRHGLALFGYYRVILAFVVAMLMASGVLPAD